MNETEVLGFGPFTAHRAFDLALSYSDVPQQTRDAGREKLSPHWWTRLKDPSGKYDGQRLRHVFCRAAIEHGAASGMLTKIEAEALLDNFAAGDSVEPRKFSDLLALFLAFLVSPAGQALVLLILGLLKGL
jgi:hypothetical protein